MNTLADYFKSSAKVQSATGFSMIFLGMITIFFPFVSSTLFTGLLALSIAGGGVATMIYAFYAQGRKSKILQFLLGLLALVAAFFVYMTPILSMYSLTAIAILYLFADGIFGLFSAYKQRKVKGSGWLVFSAICSLLLAVMLTMDWPVSGLYAVGMFVGVKLIVSGWTLTILGFTQHKLTNKAESYVNSSEYVVS